MNKNANDEATAIVVSEQIKEDDLLASIEQMLKEDVVFIGFHPDGSMKLISGDGDKMLSGGGVAAYALFYKISSKEGQDTLLQWVKEFAAKIEGEAANG
ncbi:MAG TPA: hypothetical protein PLA71_00225 [Saccharofermentans sp.]|nr:hypothetical protein [Saccharofermentans sp.]